jgi:hypothetical protein
VAVDEPLEEGVQGVGREVIRTGLDESGEPAHSAAIGLDGLLGLAVALQGA